MLHDGRLEVKYCLSAAHYKLRQIVEQSELYGTGIQTICQIADVQTDLQSAAICLLRCQIQASLQTIINLDTPNLDEEEHKLIEQYQAWVKLTR